MHLYLEKSGKSPENAISALPDPLMAAIRVVNVLMSSQRDSTNGTSGQLTPDPQVLLKYRFYNNRSFLHVVVCIPRRLEMRFGF